MTDEEEFERWFQNHSNLWKQAHEDAHGRMLDTWLEKGKRDREKVTEAINDVLSYNLPYLAKKKLRELLEEMK